MEVLIVSQRKDLWNSLAPAFLTHSLQMEIVQSLAEGLSRIRSNPPVLAILDTVGDEEKDREAHIERARKELTEILMVNAMVHSSVTTYLDEKSFHDALEGLGTLCALPPAPDPESIAKLAEALLAVQAVYN